MPKTVFRLYTCIHIYQHPLVFFHVQHRLWEIYWIWCFLVHMFCCYAYNRCCCSCGLYSRKFFFDEQLFILSLFRRFYIERYMIAYKKISTTNILGRFFSIKICRITRIFARCHLDSQHFRTNFEYLNTWARLTSLLNPFFSFIFWSNMQHSTKFLSKALRFEDRKRNVYSIL